ncbi:phosphonate metabolism protein/1,5-bisphosphokinase (PRPP-forming) PhnN [Cellulomonas sp. S1-8]|uniref:phosphonate metabolism protein/1,5-bisphosphokinase (PRPP-forming) PhnN n=1 Tax=Cellulomonas sp. S1-8 TaxID=2904790 RepID=UPI0022437648|nr:phosphonate metabolism protein/1,5-bisphosphokinase (PRPP-forming) PhnN [Cellulomonas sp. S1-8]UZN02876.1 phosphonate metabolism protein/1,5-bisphosphokinase (PRPP-forming) PhnN [Cellulomonas sp. S1-8]
MTGAFVAVVGPSGSGKDAILERARQALADDAGIVFPRRRITRPAGPGEDHEPVSESELAAAERRGELALTWRAHGLAYGIGAHVLDVAAAGGVVVANLSRGVLQQLPGLFADVRVVRVTVSDEVRLARILARGREDETAAAARVARRDPAPDHRVDLEIVNDGTLEQASAQLVQLVTRVRDSAQVTSDGATALARTRASAVPGP